MLEDTCGAQEAYCFNLSSVAEHCNITHVCSRQVALISQSQAQEIL